MVNVAKLAESLKSKTNFKILLATYIILYPCLTYEVDGFMVLGFLGR